jgi:hypothetical protein
MHDLRVTQYLCRKNIAYETTHDGSATEAVERLANFGKRHRLSLRGLKIKDLINEGRR